MQHLGQQRQHRVYLLYPTTESEKVWLCLVPLFYQGRVHRARERFQPAGM